MKKDLFQIAKKKLKSRLIVGTGKYKSFLETAKAIKASGADMVTVAIRRVNIIDKRKKLFEVYLLLANKNYKVICHQIKKYNPKYFIVSDQRTFNRVLKKFFTNI